MSTTSSRPTGTLLSPKEFVPQQATVPSSFKAIL
jgi:hypothetical protein